MAERDYQSHPAGDLEENERIKIKTALDSHNKKWAKKISATVSAIQEVFKLMKAEHKRVLGLFTQADVDALRLVHVSRPKIQAQLDSLADRIEELLATKPT